MFAPHIRRHVRHRRRLAQLREERLPACGSFTLAVEEFTPPANDLCAGAAALTFSNGTATVTANTSEATNAVQLPSGGCTQSETPGADLFYSFTAATGKVYQITLQTTVQRGGLRALRLQQPRRPPAWRGRPRRRHGHARLRSHRRAAATPSASTAPSPPSYGTSPTTGPFTLTVQEHDAPANMTCASPRRCPAAGPRPRSRPTPASRPTTSSGSPAPAPSAFVGPQLYYKVSVDRGPALPRHAACRARASTPRSTPFPAPPAAAPTRSTRRASTPTARRAYTGERRADRDRADQERGLDRRRRLEARARATRAPSP